MAIFLLIGCWGLALAQAPPGEAVDPELEPVTEAGAAEEEDLDATDPGLEETDPDFEASVDEEFTPDDEISEDYPIPLPADI